MVHRACLNPPAAAEFQPPPRLVGKRRDRDADLKSDPAATDRFQAQRRGELGGRFGADARWQNEPEDDANQDEAGEPAGTVQRSELWPEAAALEQAPNGGATVELEGGACRPCAFGRVEAAHQRLDSRDPRRGGAQLTDPPANQQWHRPEIAGPLPAHADPAMAPARG